MDDTYLWSLSVEHLQHIVQEVEKALEVDGLKINGGKTQCICSATHEGTVTVGDNKWTSPDQNALSRSWERTSLSEGGLPSSLPPCSRKPEQFGIPAATSGKCQEILALLDTWFVPPHFGDVELGRAT